MSWNILKNANDIILSQNNFWKCGIIQKLNPSDQIKYICACYDNMCSIMTTPSYCGHNLSLTHRCKYGKLNFNNWIDCIIKSSSLETWVWTRVYISSSPPFLWLCLAQAHTSNENIAYLHNGCRPALNGLLCGIYCFSRGWYHDEIFKLCSIFSCFKKTKKKNKRWCLFGGITKTVRTHLCLSQVTLVTSMFNTPVAAQSSSLIKRFGQCSTADSCVIVSSEKDRWDRKSVV